MACLACHEEEGERGKEDIKTEIIHEKMMTINLAETGVNLIKKYGRKLRIFIIIQSICPF